LKKIRPCKILRKFVANTYEIELLDDIGNSPIFNVADLYPYKMDDIWRKYDQGEIQRMQYIPIIENPQIEKILDQIIAKRTMRNVYYEYLVKSKNHPAEDTR